MRCGRGKVRILRVLGVLHKRRAGVRVFRMIRDDSVSTAYYIRSKYKNPRQKVIKKSGNGNHRLRSLKISGDFHVELLCICQF
jgi:hypothetical protein